MGEVGVVRRSLALLWVAPVLIVGLVLSVLAFPVLLITAYPLALAWLSWLRLLQMGKSADLSRLCLVTGTCVMAVGMATVLSAGTYWLLGERTFGHLFLGYGLVELAFGTGCVVPVIAQRPTRSDVLGAFKWSRNGRSSSASAAGVSRIEVAWAVATLALGALGGGLLAAGSPQVLACGRELSGFDFDTDLSGGAGTISGLQGQLRVENGYLFTFKVGATSEDVDALVDAAERHELVTHVYKNPAANDTCV